MKEKKENLVTNEKVCPTCGKTITFLKNVVLPLVAFVRFVIKMFKK